MASTLVLVQLQLKCFRLSYRTAPQCESFVNPGGLVRGKVVRTCSVWFAWSASATRVPSAQTGAASTRGSRASLDGTRRGDHLTFELSRTIRWTHSLSDRVPALHCSQPREVRALSRETLMEEPKCTVRLPAKAAVGRRLRGVRMDRQRAGRCANAFRRRSNCDLYADRFDGSYYGVFRILLPLWVQHAVQRLYAGFTVSQSPRVFRQGTLGQQRAGGRRFLAGAGCSGSSVESP